MSLVRHLRAIASEMAVAVDTAATSHGTQIGMRASPVRALDSDGTAAGLMACTISVALRGRDAGAFARHCMTIFARLEGTSGRRVAIGSGTSRAWAAMICCGERPRNGG